MGIFDSIRRLFSGLSPGNRCMACGDEVRPAGAVMGRTHDPELYRIMSIKPAYTCSRCGRKICIDCVKKEFIWRCPLCGGDMKQGVVDFSRITRLYR